ncbi:O-methyltransferase-domain-containing protein [Chaetomium fimeti]|uniref:O-methyltransferase-domain-containing protein n=1 Tax=Chaetomium fimeti TaxID=1854472 RepID=A0AAE0LPV3_9PEZI|nr:O-methyltransferase-domain-containing protein [Chaetomium fimeti]
MSGNCANKGPVVGHFATIVEMGVLKTFVEYKIFDAIPDEGDISITELADKVGAHPELLQRLANYLVAAGFLDSPAVGRVVHTDKSRPYKSTEFAGGAVAYLFDMLFRATAQLPSYFAQNGLASPETASVTPFGMAVNHPDKSLYEILVAEPKLGQAFDETCSRVGSIFPMKGVHDLGWMQQEPGALDGTRPLFVDIGGNEGAALRCVLRDNTFIPAARCAVLDLPRAIEAAEADRARVAAEEDGERLSKVQLVAGSVYEPLPAPVRGALVYQFRRVLNDFADADVARAWRSVADAAATDTRVYIVEKLLESGRPSEYGAAQDLFMMMFGGKRRSAAMHAELAAAVGFRLHKESEDRFNDFGALEFRKA